MEQQDIGGKRGQFQVGLGVCIRNEYLEDPGGQGQSGKDTAL